MDEGEAEVSILGVLDEAVALVDNLDFLLPSAERDDGFVGGGF